MCSSPSSVKSVRFATQADVVSTTSDGSGWYSNEELFESKKTSVSPPKSVYMYRGNPLAIDTILDAQDLMDDDANAQASILAAVSAKCSANARRIAQLSAQALALELRQVAEVNNNASCIGSRCIEEKSTYMYEMPFEPEKQQMTVTQI